MRSAVIPAGSALRWHVLYHVKADWNSNVCSPHQRHIKKYVRMRPPVSKARDGNALLVFLSAPLGLSYYFSASE